MVVLCHNQKDMARLETLESKNGLPVCPLALAWGRWKTEKPCIEPPLLAYLEFSLPPSKCTVKSLVSWGCTQQGWAGDPKQTGQPHAGLTVVLTCCMTSLLWFMAARQRRISFVASVFPEPLSPLAGHRASASAFLGLSTPTPTHKPWGGPEGPSALPGHS